MDILGVGGFSVGIISLGYAIYQTVQAKNAEHKADRSNEHLRGQIAFVVNALNKGSSQSQSPIQATYADLNGDGKQELLVTYPVGAHGANMIVFSWDSFGELREIGSFFGDCGPYFAVEDVDGDGLPEITTYIRNYDGNPVGDAPIPHYFKWINGEFQELRK